MLSSSDFRQHLKRTEDAYKRHREASRNGAYLYGAGFIGRWAVNHLEAQGIPVLAFIESDASKCGSQVCGKPVIGFDDLRLINVECIFITTRHAVPEITRKLNHLNSSVMSIDAYVVHNHRMADIEKLASLLSRDPISMATLWSILISMLSGERTHLEGIVDNAPYFGQFKFFNQLNEVYVDAGSYVGDTVERFLWSVNGVFNHIHAFEPGPRQFAAMGVRVKRLVEEWALDVSSISINNMALHSVTGGVRLSSSGPPTQMSVSGDGLVPGLQDSISSITLDDYLEGGLATLIKIDVEGNERNLLDGAAETIERYHPKIALSIYHFPTDIFELPLRPEFVDNEYSFSIRHHSSQLLESVLYLKNDYD